MDNLQIGDRVELVGEVTAIGETRIRMNFARPGHPDKDMVELYPCNVLAGRRVARPLAIGDRVKVKGQGNRWTAVIRAIDGLEAWLRVDGHDDRCGNGTHQLSALERAPAPDTKEGT